MDFDERRDRDACSGQKDEHGVCERLKRRRVDASPHSPDTLSSFAFADLSISTSFPLNELPRARRSSNSTPGLAFELLPTPPPEPASADWLHHWGEKTGTIAISLARRSGEFLLRFPGLADFLISESGDRISGWPAVDTSVETLRHLLLDQVLPRVLAHRGMLVLHASAVRIDRTAIAFAGETGRGKSTLAGSLNSPSSPILSDDALIVRKGEDHATVLPTYAGLRLWPESVEGLFDEAPRLAPMAHYSSKRRVDLGRATGTAHVPLPLAALYLLSSPTGDGDPDAIAVTRLSARDGCVELMRHSFQLDVSDPRQAARLLALAIGVALQVPAFVLSYPRDFSYLPAVHAAILQQRGQWAVADRCV